jgi:hypothetical protein
MGSRHRVVGPPSLNLSRRSARAQLDFSESGRLSTVPLSARSSHNPTACGLDGEIRRLIAVVRQGKAIPAEPGSGTFTLSNHGWTAPGDHQLP